MHLEDNKEGSLSFNNLFLTFLVTYRNSDKSKINFGAWPYYSRKINKISDYHLFCGTTLLA